jgi:hypothetical protein
MRGRVKATAAEELMCANDCDHSIDFWQLAVLEYRTALEDGGRYSRSEIDTRVAEFRHKQQSFEAPRQVI